MEGGTTWVGILGLLIIVIMLAYKNRSAFICGIGFITFLSWFRNTAITYFPDTLAGDDRFDYFKQVVKVEPMDMVIGNYTNDLSGAAVALITFLYVDFLDTSVSGLHKSLHIHALTVYYYLHLFPIQNLYNNRVHFWHWSLRLVTLTKKEISPSLIGHLLRMQLPLCLVASLV